MGKLVLIGPITAFIMLVSGCGSGGGKPASSVASPSPSAVATVAATPSPASTLAAQATPASNPVAQVAGTVTAVSDGKVTLQSGSSFALDGQTRITRLLAASESDIKPGAIVAVTAKRQANNFLLASTVLILPAAPSSTFFRQSQCPQSAGNLMTNATVDKVDGRSFTVTFPSGSDQVTLAPDAALLKSMAGAASDVAAGSSISAGVKDGVAQSVSVLSGPPREVC